MQELNKVDIERVGGGTGILGAVTGAVLAALAGQVVVPGAANSNNNSNSNTNVVAG